MNIFFSSLRLKVGSGSVIFSSRIQIRNFFQLDPDPWNKMSDPHPCKKLTEIPGWTYRWTLGRTWYLWRVDEARESLETDDTRLFILSETRVIRTRVRMCNGNPFPVVVVVYHEAIVASGHGLSKNFFLVIDSVLRSAGRSF